MKKFIIGVIIILTALMGCQTVKAQSYSKEGKTFITQKSTGASDDISTDYIWKDSKGNEYTIYLHKYTKGEKAGEWTTYVFRISQKTGKKYKYYLPSGDEIAKEIREDLGLK